MSFSGPLLISQDYMRWSWESLETQQWGAISWVNNQQCQLEEERLGERTISGVLLGVRSGWSSSGQLRSGQFSLNLGLTFGSTEWTGSDLEPAIIVLTRLELSGELELSDCKSENDKATIYDEISWLFFYWSSSYITVLSFVWSRERATPALLYLKELAQGTLLS